MKAVTRRGSSGGATMIWQLSPIYIRAFAFCSLFVVIFLLEGCDACNRRRDLHPGQVSTSKHYVPLVLDYPHDGVQLANGWNSNESHKTPGVCIDYATHDD